MVAWAAAMPIIQQAGKDTKAGMGATVDLVGGLIGMYHAAKARKEGKRKLDEIEDLIKSIVPPDIEIDPDKLLQSPQLILDEVKLRPLDFSRIEGPQFQQIQKYIPEIAPLIAEQRPELAQQTERGKEGEAAFMEALQEMRRVGRAGGEDPIARAATRRAQDAANRAAQGRQQAILQDMARRGTLGSGAEVAAQLQGASDAMGRAGSMARDAQADAYLRQLQAMRDAGRMGQQLSDTEFARASQQANIINQFNQRATAAAQRHADQRAAEMNKAQLFDVQERQRLADRTTQAGYDAAVRSQEYLNDLGFREADFGQTEADRRNRAMGQQFRMDQAIQEDLRRRKQQKFDNERALAGDRAGVMYSKYDDIGARAQGTGQNIRGITKSASGMIRAGGGTESTGGAGGGEGGGQNPLFNVQDQFAQEDGKENIFKYDAYNYGQGIA